jgi:hypothetical protein
MASRAGSSNKNKAFLLKRLQDMYGDDFHPIMKMAENAVSLQTLADTTQDDANIYKAALDGWDKVASYTEPKLKAIEISGDPDNPLEIVDGLTPIARAARIAAILEQGRESRAGHITDSGDADMDATTRTTDGSREE